MAVQAGFCALQGAIFSVSLAQWSQREPKVGPWTSPTCAARTSLYCNILNPLLLGWARRTRFGPNYSGAGPALYWGAAVYRNVWRNLPFIHEEKNSRAVATLFARGGALHPHRTCFFQMVLGRDKMTWKWQIIFFYFLSEVDYIEFSKKKIKIKFMLMKCHFLTCDYNICAIDFASLSAKFSLKARLSLFCNFCNLRGFSHPRSYFWCTREGSLGEDGREMLVSNGVVGCLGLGRRQACPSSSHHGRASHKIRALEWESRISASVVGKRRPSPSLFEKCTWRHGVGTNGTFLFKLILFLMWMLYFI